ncbi:four helix bundle protein [Mucilaginibacter sp. X4EP1]|uniref:four helix bundle protein n=1 Tax=Mucilaginibacter sp. X4EP1 TaxID=2723092 RepID=UPI002168A42A|nr:four helix bundle protein [Mucilaginibacter sp. X4EP1]MCS3814858.1 four helix bundle protein [Mucilaginibacter sp. X4EP1]
MQPVNDLKLRSKTFALNIIKLVKSLPEDRIGRVLGNQILRSGTSVAANYRSACKARSIADFISKITVVEEEADETTLWLELIMESGTLNDDFTQLLHKEANELTAILTSSGKTAKQNSSKKK